MNTVSGNLFVKGRKDIDLGLVEDSLNFSLDDRDLSMFVGERNEPMERKLGNER